MATATNKCTSIAGHFDDHAEVLKRYMWHRLMQHVQGYTGSYWMPPSGDYSLCFASEATRAALACTIPWIWIVSAYSATLTPVVLMMQKRSKSTAIAESLGDSENVSMLKNISGLKCCGGGFKPPHQISWEPQNSWSPGEYMSQR